MFKLWAKARKFENEHAWPKVLAAYNSKAGQRITLKVTKTFANGTKKTIDIVPDFVVKNAAGKLKIIDAKFTTKAAADFIMKNSFTKNQRAVFGWMKNGDNIVVKVTANAEKLLDLGIPTGTNITISGIEILKSKADDILQSDFVKYF